MVKYRLTRHRGARPEETIPKAQHIHAAALAPADPSAQDQSVAAEASLMEANARIELSAQQREKPGETTSVNPTSSNQIGARFYQATAQSNEKNVLVGGWLNSFA